MRSGPPCPAGAARAAAGRPAPSCSSGAFARPTSPPRVIPHRGGVPDAPPSPTPAPPSPPGPSAGAGRAPLWVVARKRRVECSERRQSRGDDALCPFGGEGARRGKRRLGGARAKRADSSRPGGWIAARVEAKAENPPRGAVRARRAAWGARAHARGRAPPGAHPSRRTLHAGQTRAAPGPGFDPDAQKGRRAGGGAASGSVRARRPARATRPTRPARREAAKPRGTPVRAFPRASPRPAASPFRRRTSAGRE